MYALIPAILVVVLGGGGLWYFVGGNAGQTSSATRPADTETAALLSDVVWPSYVSRGSGGVKEAYQFAVARPDVLKWMPCFCGCINNGHTSNEQCFIQNRNSGGSTIAFDQHGAT